MITINSTCDMLSGQSIPIFGLGLYRVPDNNLAQDTIKCAWEAGYRLFDTAQIYGNESSLGKALKNIDVSRNSFFVTTKLWRNAKGDDVFSSLRESLDKLQLDFVDLFLMHWPVKEHRLDNWDQMIKLRDEGFAKDIGVSNFTLPHLVELLDHSDVIPAVNQMEHSIYLNNLELVDFCQDNGIVYQSYSPLTKARKLNDPKLTQLSEEYGKTPAQIMIRFILQQGISVIPKSTNRDRIVENSEVFDFEITKTDMDEMNNWNENLVTGWNPYNYD